mmetsp:Transcript_18949/g.28804  ORF Transcript_18949/g.28804 Transcript_18949/m.28804 type:complete len:176 (-) Transcript_18949:654-1181(-)
MVESTVVVFSETSRGHKSGLGHIPPLPEEPRDGLLVCLISVGSSGEATEGRFNGEKEGRIEGRFLGEVEKIRVGRIVGLKEGNIPAGERDGTVVGKKEGDRSSQLISMENKSLTATSSEELSVALAKITTRYSASSSEGIEKNSEDPRLSQVTSPPSSHEKSENETKFETETSLL